MVVLPKHPHSSENGIQEGDWGILSPSLTQAYNYKPQTTALLLELEPLEGKDCVLFAVVAPVTGMWSVFNKYLLVRNEGSCSYYQFFKNFIKKIHFQRGREGEREGEKYQCMVASPAPSTVDLATTQACALTGIRISDPLVRSPLSIHWATPARANFLFIDFKERWVVGRGRERERESECNVDLLLHLLMYSFWSLYVP